MRFVPIKPDEEQDLQALHPMREQLAKQIRGLLRERGIVVAKAIGQGSSTNNNDAVEISGDCGPP